MLACTSAGLRGVRVGGRRHRAGRGARARRRRPRDLAGRPLRARDGPPQGRRPASGFVPRRGTSSQDQGNSVRCRRPDAVDLRRHRAERRRPTFFVTSSAGVADPGRHACATCSTPAPARRPSSCRARRRARAASRDERYVAIWPTGATVLPDGRIVIAYTKYLVNGDPARFYFLAAGSTPTGHPPPAPAGSSAPGRPADRRRHLDAGDGRSPRRSWPAGTSTSPSARSQRCYSLRAPAGQVAERSAYRWWTGDGGWSATAADRAPMRYGDDHPGRNPPTAYLARSRVWVTVDTSHGIQSDSGLIWVAPRPWGPWSKVAKFDAAALHPRGRLLHAERAPGGSPPGMLRVSYATAHDGPHVRVVDVPIAVHPGGSAADGQALRAGWPPWSPCSSPRPTRSATWLAKHHATETEVLVGYWKAATGKPSLTWPSRWTRRCASAGSTASARGSTTSSFAHRFTPRKRDTTGAWSTSARSRR